jgi:hypothetical protein
MSAPDFSSARNVLTAGQFNSSRTQAAKKAGQSSGVLPVPALAPHGSSTGSWALHERRQRLAPQVVAAAAFLAALAVHQVSSVIGQRRRAVGAEDVAKGHLPLLSLEERGPTASLDRSAHHESPVDGSVTLPWEIRMGIFVDRLSNPKDL